MLCGALALGALLFNRELLVLAGVFAVVLLLWGFQLRRAARHPWVLTVGDDEVVFDSEGATKTVRRSDTARVHTRRRTSRYAPATYLVFRGRAKEVLLEVGPHQPDLPAILAALRSRGWPLP